MVTFCRGTVPTWVNSGVDIVGLLWITFPMLTSPHPLNLVTISWNGLEWVNYDAPSVQNLSDTLLTTLSVRQSLVWDGTNWTNLYLSIDDASDVTIGTTATNQSLVWNGSQWVNSYLSINDASDVLVPLQLTSLWFGL